MKLRFNILLLTLVSLMCIAPQRAALDVDKAVKRMINGVLYIFHGDRVYNAQGAIVDNPEK